MLHYIGNTRTTKAKSTPNKLETKVPFRSLEKPSFLVIDGCVILYVINQSANGTLFGDSCDFIFLQLKSQGMVVFFDKCHGFSIKFLTIADRGMFFPELLIFSIATITIQICSMYKCFVESANHHVCHQMIAAKDCYGILYQFTFYCWVIG